ncbi:MAG: ABC transporter substrate-binding protein [Bacillales bacterium]|nr:ABC transporter substrate-binding protein [Bacillales bacterium]
MLKNLLTLVGVVAVVGCRPVESSSSTPTSDGGTVSSSAPEINYTGTRQGISATEILVGNTAATSGGYAAVGIPFNLAMNVVFQEYNYYHTRKIKLQHYDDTFDGSIGLTQTTKLVEEDHVFALVGHFGTNTVNSTVDYIQEKGIPMVYGVTGVNSLYFEHDPGNPILSIQPIYRTEGKVLLARILHEKLYGAQKNAAFPANGKVVLLYTEDDAGNSIRVGVEEEATFAGITLQKFPFTVETAASVAAQAKAASPAAIIVASNQPGFTATVTALKSVTNTAPVFSSYVNANATNVTSDGSALPFDVYANAWVDIVDAAAPGPLHPDLQALPYGEITLPAAAFPGFTEEYWAEYVRLMVSSDLSDGVTTAGSLWANNFAVAGFVAAKAFVALLDRVDLDRVTWDSFIQVAESAPLDLPLCGEIDWGNGSRVGLDTLSLNRYYPISDTHATSGFDKVRPTEGLATIRAK